MQADCNYWYCCKMKKMYLDKRIFEGLGQLVSTDLENVEFKIPVSQFVLRWISMGDLVIIRE